MADCIFCKIRDRIIPKEFTYEDEDVMVFPDIYPLKPIHILIIPKKHIEDLLMINDPHFAKASRGKEGLMVKLIKTVQRMVKKFKLEDKGYRVAVNGGGAQAINHLHFHLIGPMGRSAEMSA
ncbi:MAG: HIT domain-containing protein [Candidatus Levybacteria bacterium]|nr:HIT domain-containing protein [Candidatus Levybacteria bacterium]MDZ4228527.1 HIT domain-containing protein [Candidatus Levybacteria bacterium]